MSTEFIFALALWLLITVVTPGKIRLFISFLSASLILVLLFFTMIGPRELVVSIPSFGDARGYDIPYDDFLKLAEGQTDGDVIAYPGAESLSELGKDFIQAEDLTPEQMAELGAVPGVEDFKAGKTGMILHNVPSRIENGVFHEGYHGFEFIPLPLYEELKRKQDVLDAIKDVVREAPAPRI